MLPECAHSKKKSLASVCVCVRARTSLRKLASVSPGQGDTGISGDEPQTEEAVIEVFRKVRGD